MARVMQRTVLQSITHVIRSQRIAPVTPRVFQGILYPHNRCQILGFSSTVPKLKKDTVKVIFVFEDNNRETVQAKVGDNLLDVIVENNVDLDGFGACEGTLACSTCHLIFKPEDYTKIPDKATDEELDMLDLAYGLTDTSRLGCQVIITEEMDGLEVIVPAAVEDARGGGL